MIPKTIHYCWFGRGKKPRAVQKCIASWKKFCPNYNIIEWNEDNFDVDMNAYVQMCIELKKYAFLSDYARLRIIYEHGGLYFDTDVEVLRPFDDLLNNEAFFGFENDSYVASGLGFGAEPASPVVEMMLREYDPLLDGCHKTIGCPILNTEALIKIGLKQNGQLQALPGATIYPASYFNPMNSATGEISISKNTYSIHRYSMLWLPWRRRVRSKITQVFHRFFGVDCFAILKGK